MVRYGNSSFLCRVSVLPVATFLTYLIPPVCFYQVYHLFHFLNHTSLFLFDYTKIVKQLPLNKLSTILFLFFLVGEYRRPRSLSLSKCGLWSVVCRPRSLSLSKCGLWSAKRSKQTAKPPRQKLFSFGKYARNRYPHHQLADESSAAGQHCHRSR